MLAIIGNLIGLLFLSVVYMVLVSFMAHFLLVSWGKIENKRKINLFSVGIPLLFYLLVALVMSFYLTLWVIISTFVGMGIFGLVIYLYFQKKDKQLEENY